MDKMPLYFALTYHRENDMTTVQPAQLSSLPSQDDVQAGSIEDYIM